MLDRGPDKYHDLPKAQPLDLIDLLNVHARGVATYAATLDLDGRARAGVIDIDAGGRVAIDAALAAAAELGLAAWAIAVDNPDGTHRGGHLWVLYQEWHPVAAIAAQLGQVAAAAGLGDAEIWPSSQVIRLPFGIHQRARTRGRLVLQCGQVIELDRDLAAGLAAVQALLLNIAPPACAEPEIISGFAPARHARAISPGEVANEQLTGTRAIAAFNRAHPLSTMLERGPGGNYFCPCGGHDSGKPKIAIWTGADGVERGQSYSPDCRWFPLHRSGKVLDPFEYYVLSEHGGDRVAALKAINPIAPNQAKSRYEEPPHPADEYLTRDAARQRATRQAARAVRQARIAPLIEQIASAKICAFDRVLWAYHGRRWAERDAPEHYDSVERIARAVLQLDQAPTEHQIRRVQLGHKRLSGRGYLKSTVRYRPGEHKTNCWQPGDGGMVIRPDLAHQDATNEARITMLDHESGTLLDSETCERGGHPPTPERACEAPAPTRDTVGGGVSLLSPSVGGQVELGELEKPNGSVFVEPAAPTLNTLAASVSTVSTLPDPALLSYVRQLAREEGSAGWYLNDYATWSAAALEGEAERLAALLQVAGDMPPAATEEIPQSIVLDDQAAAGETEQLLIGNYPNPATLRDLEICCSIEQDAGGASYNPTADWTAGGVLDPQLRDPAYNPLADYRAPAPAGEEIPHLVDLVEPEPLIPCPPVEPAAAAQYWKLLGRAKKSHSAAQRQLLEGKAAQLEIWLPISEAPAPTRSSSRPLRVQRVARAAPPLTSSSPGPLPTLDMFALAGQAPP